MAYRLGVDVGGTFTDVLLIDEETGNTWMEKVQSTPVDSSLGVLQGIDRVCRIANIQPESITQIMHGTTVATNAILQSHGAKIGLVTTKGYKQMLQIGRSFVPGILAGWIIWNMPDPLAPLELTVEANERIGARGDVVDPLDEPSIIESLKFLNEQGIEALTISLINAYANGSHEQRIREIAYELMPDVAVSISSEILPEMQEYERHINHRSKLLCGAGGFHLSHQYANTDRIPRHSSKAEYPKVRRWSCVGGSGAVRTW